jgi:soluble lytic murein transglycosylase
LGQASGEGDPLGPLLKLDSELGEGASAMIVPAGLSDGLSDELGPYALLLQARELRRVGQEFRAPAILEPLLTQADPLVAANARLELAECALSQGHPAEARKQQRQVLATRLLPAELRARALEGLGRSSEAAGDRRAARAAFEQAVALDPEGETGERALNALGSLETGKAPVGIPAVRQSLAAAKRLLLHGRPQAAFQELSELRLPRNPDPALLGEIELCIAQCDRALGRLSEAEIHLTRARELTTVKSGAAARVALARERELSGDWRGALHELLEVADADAHAKVGSDALYLAAFIALQHHEMDTAQDLFRRLLPGRRWQHADEARWWLGWIDFRNRAYARALDDWAPLLNSEGPTGIQVRFWAARAQQNIDAAAEAERLRADLLRISPVGYYALLLRDGAVPQSPGPADDCPHEGTDATWVGKLRVVELLWALGHTDYASEEMHALVERASPDRALLLSDVLAQLGDPGWAFTVAVDHAASCHVSPLSPTLYPRPYAKAVEQAARAADVDPLLLWAIMRQESHFRARAHSAAQAFGPMQLLTVTSSRIAAITGTRAGEFDDPNTAMMTAAWYLRALSDRFGPDPALSAAAYNAGPDALARWLSIDGDRPLDVFVEEIPFRETRRYVKTVIANYAAYRSLFGEADGPVIAPGKPTWSRREGGEGIDF